MKHFISLIFVLMVTAGSMSSTAQRHEFGLFLGGNYYLGDLVDQHFFGQIGPSFGLMYRYDFNRRISARIAAHYGTIYGDSKNNRKSLQYKNLDFFSPLFDLDMGIEINFLEFDPDSRGRRFTPFVYGGFSIFRFNPQTEYMGKIYELQPLGTEGQGTTNQPDRKSYKLTSASIPFGFGFKWAVSKRLNIGIEWGMRKTFTDYLDDVSTTYPNIELLAAENSPLAAVLSVRMYEDMAKEFGLNIAMGANGMPASPADYALYMEMIKNASNGQRGNSENMDWYSIFGVTFTFKIVGPRQKTCPAYKKHLNYKEYLTF
ncbi:MAG: outer membrane beta-barrel protein [Bacteroidales bacterium]|nr:outer membrane beta-barrel protein [Bacteroidales bacterium]